MKYQRTRKVALRNPTEWHQGIESYGFWALVIRDDQWVKAFEVAQKYVSEWVLPGYLRLPHITLSACGLIDDTHFSKSKLAQQISALENLSLSEFQVMQNGLDCFETAPYLSIAPNKTLSTIRQALEYIHQDNPARDYTPHITLGFFNDEYSSIEINSHLKALTISNLPPLSIDRICYCSYQTNSIQGEISIQHELLLSPSVKTRISI